MKGKKHDSSGDDDGIISNRLNMITGMKKDLASLIRLHNKFCSNQKNLIDLIENNPALLKLLDHKEEEQFLEILKISKALFTSNIFASLTSVFTDFQLQIYPYKIEKQQEQLDDTLNDTLEDSKENQKNVYVLSQRKSYEWGLYYIDLNGQQIQIDIATIFNLDKALAYNSTVYDMEKEKEIKLLLSTHYAETIRDLSQLLTDFAQVINPNNQAFSIWLKNISSNTNNHRSLCDSLKKIESELEAGNENQKSNKIIRELSDVIWSFDMPPFDYLVKIKNVFESIYQKCNELGLAEDTETSDKVSNHLTDYLKEMDANMPIPKSDQEYHASRRSGSSPTNSYDCKDAMFLRNPNSQSKDPTVDNIISPGIPSVSHHAGQNTARNLSSDSVKDTVEEYDNTEGTSSTSPREDHDENNNKNINPKFL